MKLLVSVIYLISLMSNVESQVPVLTPSVLYVNQGQTGTYNCNVGVKNAHATVFLRQTPGKTPQLILYHHHSYTEPKYGSGMSSAHFGSTINGAGTEYQLIVKNTDTRDTDTYYCVKWYDNIGWVFSERSKLIVTVDKFPEPALLVFPPYTEDNESKDSSTLTCHISKLAVSLVNVKWLIDGTTVQDGVSTSNPVRESDNTFSMSSYLTLASKDVNKDRMYSCIIQQEGSSAFISKGVKLSQC
ncbi:immunoglobulin lambda-1 light chain isoform X11 [Xenopus laevis]|uniref:immunoglobulin lambda-1 light chain isoform X11 n=1 Tax=Xenopus laevis TaxID=8355 RepID=UPI001BB27B60|nr:immunoglobulin lambda-1 light chain isoform X11 [Xenopus laevis]